MTPTPTVGHEPGGLKHRCAYCTNLPTRAVTGYRPVIAEFDLACSAAEASR